MTNYFKLIKLLKLSMLFLFMLTTIASCDFFTPLVSFDKAKEYYDENIEEFNQIAELLMSQHGLVVVARKSSCWEPINDNITYFFSCQSYYKSTSSIRINLEGVNNEPEFWNNNLDNIKDANIDLTFGEFLNSCDIDSALVFKVIQFLFDHQEIKIINKPSSSDNIIFEFKGSRGFNYFSSPKDIPDRNEKGWKLSDKWYYFQD